MTVSSELRSVQVRFRYSGESDGITALVADHPRDLGDGVYEQSVTLRAGYSTEADIPQILSIANGRPVQLVQGYTPSTDDVREWMEGEYPEGDVAVVHTWECDLRSCGDECVGGCTVVSA